MTTRETVLAACKSLAREQVSTPNWGGDVWVRAFSAAEHLAIQDENPDPIDVCVKCVCDEHGEPLFAADDIDALRAGPSSPVFECAKSVMRLTGFLGDSNEELAGNSDAVPGDDSPSI